MKLFRASAIVGGFTMLSRVLGFVREMLFAAALGTGPMAAAFFVAFRFPNLFRRWFAEGAFNAAFLPIYAEKLEGEGQEAANRFASDTLSGLLLVLFLFVLVMELAMPWLMVGLAPGFMENPGLFAKVVLFTQITTPYILFMSVSAMLGGVLNAHHKFGIAAFAPVLLNLVFIAILLQPADSASQLAWHLSFGVLLSGLLQAGTVYWGLRKAGIRLRLVRPKISPDMVKLLKLGIPGAIAAGVVQINLVVSQAFASLQDGAVPWLYYADRLYQLPLGVVGVAMGVALLPALSRKVRAGDQKGAIASQNEALLLAAAFTLPAAVALYVLPGFFVEGLFMRDAFTANDADAVARVLKIYALGLPAFILIKVFAPGFFARQNTKTPMLVASFSILLNIGFGAALFFQIGYVGLAIATSFAGWLNGLVLGFLLWRQGLFVPDRLLFSRLFRVTLAAVAMGFVLVLIAIPVRDALSFLPAWYLLATLAVSAIGAVVYGLAALLFGAIRRADLRTILRGG
ncbi:Proposed peptidoglycan lipid II flippase MurJ [hydrothermal vent metagenome]|uniref:Proposed peptidoglycan lipid II flippase MurJ n=1 Tax=hydrothermal vent metagenome TaxID=652676 RepID=A0A3B0RT18_9ZZZZ